jgi:hypothetical protein
MLTKGLSLLDFVYREEADYASEIDQLIFEMKAISALESVNQRQAYAVSVFLGLNDGRQKSFVEMADIIPRANTAGFDGRKVRHYYGPISVAMARKTILKGICTMRWIILKNKKRFEKHITKKGNNENGIL